MAVKNTNLGGTDWTDGDILYAADLNDTFDAATNKIQTLSTFYLNGSLSTVHEDFESYNTGSWAAPGWTLGSTTEGEGAGSYSFRIISGANYVGSGNEFYIMVQSKTAGAGGGGQVSATTTNIPSGHNIFYKVYGIVNGNVDDNMQGTISTRVGGVTVDSRNITGKGGPVKIDTGVLVVAVSGPTVQYDIYKGGGIFVGSSNTCQIAISAQRDADDTNFSYMVIDDITISKSSVYD